jgi:capsular exopolysaccharide synthesis family protein
MQRPEQDSQFLDLHDLLTLLRRQKGSIALVTILITALAVGFVAWRTPVYTSLAQVEVRPLTIDEQLQPFASDSFVNMDTEAARVTQEPVAKLAAPAMGLDPTSPTELAEAVDGVSVTVQASTTYLDISCTKPSPEAARTCAMSLAGGYIRYRVDGAMTLYDERVEAERERIQQANEQIELLNEQLDQLSEEQDAARTTVEAQIDAQSQLIVAAQTNVLSLPTASPDAAVLVRSADFPMKSSNKDYLSTGGLTVILGLALGIALAFVRQRLAEPITDREDLEHVLEAPVLAAVPDVLYGDIPFLVTVSAPDSPASHAYRGAGAALVHLAREGSLKAIAVTGPSEGEGKTPATGNLAVALAQSGRQVVAVSCDLRNPTLHRFLGRGNDLGVTDILIDAVPLGEALQETDASGLFVLASGKVSDDPTDLLSSEDMRRLLAELRTRFDFVLLDAGPGLVADVLFLAPHVDGIIVVADAAKTSREGVAHLRRQLESVGGRIIGGILNNWAPKHAGHQYPHYFLPDLGTPVSAGSAEYRAERDGEGGARGKWSGVPEAGRGGNQAALAPPSEDRS